MQEENVAAKWNKCLERERERETMIMVRSRGTTCKYREETYDRTDGADT